MERGGQQELKGEDGVTKCISKHPIPGVEQVANSINRLSVGAVFVRYYLITCSKYVRLSPTVRRCVRRCQTQLC